MGPYPIVFHPVCSPRIMSTLNTNLDRHYNIESLLSRYLCGICLVGRVVKAMVLSTIGHCPRGFDPHTKQFGLIPQTLKVWGRLPNAYMRDDWQSTRPLRRLPSYKRTRSDQPTLIYRSGKNYSFRSVSSVGRALVL